MIQDQNNQSASSFHKDCLEDKSYSNPELESSKRQNQINSKHDQFSMVNSIREVPVSIQMDPQINIFQHQQLFFDDIAPEGTKKNSNMAPFTFQKNDQQLVSKPSNFMFPLKLQNEKLISSHEFTFQNNQDNGSLFSSQKKSSHNESKYQKNKDLQNYKMLLKNYYNENYFQSQNQIILKSDLRNNVSVRRSQIPYFITRQCITFYKRSEGIRCVNGLSGNFLCRLVESRIYYKNVATEQLTDKDYLQCEYLQLQKNQKISPSLQIDSNAFHLYYYSNKTNEIVVVSLLKKKQSNSEICRIKAKFPRENPLLYLISINETVLLFVIGGYNLLANKQNKQNKEVEASKYIQVFSIDKWGKNLYRSKVIKLMIGKIYPLIVFPIKVQQNESMILIGGNEKGTKIENCLTFKRHKELNESSNLRGYYIYTKQIRQLLNMNKEILTLDNANVLTIKTEQNKRLYNGYVDIIKYDKKQRIRLFLPKTKEFYAMKIIKKEVRVIKYRQKHQRYVFKEVNQSYHHLQMKSFKNVDFEYYQISEEGIFKAKPTEVQKQSSICSCPSNCQVM